MWYNMLQGESKRMGPSGKKTFKIDVDMIFEKWVSDIQGWVSVLILWKPHGDCFIRILDMLISVKPWKKWLSTDRYYLTQLKW